jgi:hypothetical protein
MPREPYDDYAPNMKSDCLIGSELLNKSKGGGVRFKEREKTPLQVQQSFS